jgi:hypothetical protein
LHSEAEAACLEVASPKLNDMLFSERLFVDFQGEAGRKFRREGSSSRTQWIAPETRRGECKYFRVFRGGCVGEDVLPVFPNRMEWGVGFFEVASLRSDRRIL